MASVAPRSVTGVGTITHAEEQCGDHSRPGRLAIEAAKSRKRKKEEMLPPAPKNAAEVSNGQRVIDDEEFEAKLAAIIERDYFPDVKRLQNRLEWSEAAETRDPDCMANAQRNIVLRRAGFSVPMKAELPTSAPELTPTPTRSTSHSNCTPAATASVAPSDGNGVSSSQNLPEGAILPPSLPLQRFTSANTTEDHASMESIVAADNARRRVRYAWAYEESARTNSDMKAKGHQAPLLTACNASAAPPQPQVTGRPTALLITVPEDGGGTANATLARRARRMLAPRTAGSVGGGLQTTPPRQTRTKEPPSSAATGLHNPKSALYYTPSGTLPLSMAERREMSSGAPPSTVAANTRFGGNPYADGTDAQGSVAESPSTLASTPVSAMSGTSREVSPFHNGSSRAEGAAAEPQIGGGGWPVRTVLTPSPSPGGVGGAPIMTWGEVGATPMALEDSGDDGRLYEGAAVGGKAGCLPTPRSVKEAAAEKARRDMAVARARDPARAAQQQLRGQQWSRRGGVAMSPAARSFMKRLQGKSPWAQVDAQLRATYGHRTPGSAARVTPAPADGTPSGTAAAGLLGERTPERRP